MNAVIYDPASGAILASVQGSAESIAADPRPHIQVDEARDDYDVTHIVVDGRLVAKPDAG